MSKSVINLNDVTGRSVDLFKTKYNSVATNLNTIDYIKIHSVANTRGCSIAAIVREALSQWIEDHEQEIDDTAQFTGSLFR